MPTPTYTPLATVTLGSAASSVTFSSIPATYRDLILIVNGSVSATATVRGRFNSDTGSNYPAVMMTGRNNLAESGSGTYDALDLSWNTLVATDRFMVQASVMDYQATDKHKSVLIRNHGVTASFGTGVYAQAARWANTSAITSFQVFTSTANFNSGTTFSLYGIAS